MDKQDKNDLMELVYTYLDYKRCAGDRLVHGHYCCIHCGSSEPDTECEAPKKPHIYQANNQWWYGAPKFLEHSASFQSLLIKLTYRGEIGNV